jgi:hypothetical protein
MQQLLSLLSGRDEDAPEPKKNGANSIKVIELSPKTKKKKSKKKK